MLELEGLTKRYGDVVALDGLSLHAQRGRMHGFVGRNGAGKTTAMRITLGLIEPDEGAVRWEGGAVGPSEWRSFGYMPEERGLYPKMSALEQVTFFARLSGMAAAEAERAATDVLDRLGIGERARDLADALSLGNQQRVQLAIALAPAPDLLVLDEPFSGLDPVGVDVLTEVLRGEVARGAAVVFSSHQLELVERLCDEVTIIDAGRAVAAGAIDDLRRQRGAERLVVEVEGAGGSAWADGLAGVSVVKAGGAEVVLELAPGTDDQAVLDAARAAGRVTSFRWTRPTLSELFREVVPR